MRIRNLLGVAALFGGIAVLNSAQAQQIVIDTWPSDVPCSILSQNPDGSFTLTQTVQVGDDPTDTIGAGNTFQTTDEYSVWTANCGTQ